MCTRQRMARSGLALNSSDMESHKLPHHITKQTGKANNQPTAMKRMVLKWKIKKKLLVAAALAHAQVFRMQMELHAYIFGILLSNNN